MKTMITVLGVAACAAMGQVESSATSWIGQQIVNAKGQVDSTTITARDMVVDRAAQGDVGVAGGGTAYYIDNGTRPWGLGDYDLAMDAVFGGGNWTAATYFDDPNAILANADFIYLEGSDSSAADLSLWLNTNTGALETWVSGGGNLYINAAPNAGGNIAFPFGATLVYPDFSGEGHASFAHPIFDGPFTPVATDYTGNFFGHGTISGGGVTVIENEFGVAVLTEGTNTGGTVMMGGMTAPVLAAARSPTRRTCCRTSSPTSPPAAVTLRSSPATTTTTSTAARRRGAWAITPPRWTQCSAAETGPPRRTTTTR